MRSSDAVAPGPLVLSAADPLAVGRQRVVFEDPRCADRLVKVMRREAIEARWGRGAGWYKRLPRARHYTGYVRELKEYIASRARFPALDAPIARMIGLVETDLGLGLVLEKVRGDGGALAPTLAERYARERGFSAAMERELARFLEDLLACRVIVGDMHAWNIVFGSDSRGGPRFVMVDGFGAKHAIPFTSMSRHFNAHNTRKLFRRMREQLRELVPLDTGGAGG